MGCNEGGEFPAMSIQDLQITPMNSTQSDACPGRQERIGPRRSRATKRTLASAVPLLAACLLLTGFGSLIGGCGSGGGNSAVVGGNPNPNPNPNGSNSLVSGSVTDLTGNPIVGAAVVFNGQTATSTLEGTYTIPNVLVPAGQSSLVGNVQATKTIGGRAWSGQNYLEVLSGEPDTSNIHIVMSPSSTQNVISGTIQPFAAASSPYTTTITATNGAYSASAAISASLNAGISSGLRLVIRLPSMATS